MSDIFKPMLACEVDLDKLRFPLLASAKLDGVRAIVRDGVVYSRSNKPIPNKFVQQQFKHLEHFDGELIVGFANSRRGVPRLRSRCQHASTVLPTQPGSGPTATWERRVASASGGRRSEPTARFRRTDAQPRLRRSHPARLERTLQDGSQYDEGAVFDEAQALHGC